MLISISVNETITDAKLPPGLARISHDELVLIEMQGALEVECNDPSERNGRLVGKLTMDETTQKSTLRIGHHLLEGKVATLSKPLAVIIKSTALPPSSLPSYRRLPLSGRSELEEEDGALTADRRPNGWDVVAVVKRKIVFGKRPMPIVGRQLAN